MIGHNKIEVRARPKFLPSSARAEITCIRENEGTIQWMWTKDDESWALLVESCRPESPISIDATLLRIQHPRCCWQFLAGCCGDHPPEKTRQLQQNVTLEAPNMKLPDVVGTSESFPIFQQSLNNIKLFLNATIKSDHMIHNVISADIIVSHCRCLLCQQKEVWLRLKCNLQGHVRGRNFASPDTRSNGKNRL